jgi:hypothetical protein
VGLSSGHGPAYHDQQGASAETVGRACVALSVASETGEAPSPVSPIAQPFLRLNDENILEREYDEIPICFDVASKLEIAELYATDLVVAGSISPLVGFGILAASVTIRT